MRPGCRKTVEALAFLGRLHGEWCNHADFRAALPTLLRGEDPEFSGYIQRLATSNPLLMIKGTYSC